jgi:hypothetical protein
MKQLGFRIRIRIVLVLGSWIRIGIKITMEPWSAVEAQMEAWRVCMSAVADKHHLDEQDPNPQ